jgi:hypothetical protein
MPVENRGTSKKPRWRYAFTIRGVRYRASIPEARTKFEAEQAELEAKKAIFEGRYGRPQGKRNLADFIEQIYLPWARENKRSSHNDIYGAPLVCDGSRARRLRRSPPC